MTTYRVITDGARVVAEFDADDRSSGWREGNALALQHRDAGTARGGYQLSEWTGSEWRLAGDLWPDREAEPTDGPTDQQPTGGLTDG